MRRLTIRQHQPAQRDAVESRLVELLATGLERLLAKDPTCVDFVAHERVTTTCPDDGIEDMDE
jgi:hypothetical protein